MKKQLANASKIAGKNKSMYILENALIDEQNITITDLDVFYIFKHGLNVQGKGLVNFNSFKKTFDKLKTIDSISFSENKCTIAKGKTKVSYDSPNVDEFVTIPKGNMKDVGNIVLDELFATAQSFTSRDDLRPAMQGVYIDKDKIVSTDAHKMFFKNHGFTITRPFIAPKQSFFARGEFNIQTITQPKAHDFDVESVYIVLTNSDETIIFRDVYEKYPNYDAVIPKDNPNCSRFDVKSLKEHIDLLMLTANEHTKQVNVYPDKMTSEDIDLGSYGEIEIIQNIIKGDAMDISFNGRLMTDCLNALSEREVEIETSTQGKAMILNGYILLMPVMRNF